MDPDWLPPFNEDREKQLRRFALRENDLRVRDLAYPLFMRELWAEIDRLREQLRNCQADLRE